MDSPWSLSGRRRLQVRHRDGSVFPVDFSISKFTKDDTVWYSGRIRRVDETNTSMTEGEESLGHAPHDNNLVGDYIVEGNVGQGSYGKVKLAYHRATRQQVAIKILQKDLMDSAEEERSRREITIQGKLIHPNIARLYDVIESEDRINIVMEYSKGGELLTYITKQGKLTENEARRLFLQLLSAVQYCHSLNIIHRDIKHKNILLDDAKNIKLIDFGLSNYSRLGALRSTFCGTPAYTAPEMILAKKYVGPEVDVWSMGVVLFTMVAGRFPFGNVSHIIAGQYTLPETISPVLADLIRKMLTVDTEKRISVNEVNMHPWVALGGKELAPLRPSSLGSSGLSFGAPIMANTGEWSRPASMPPQDHQGHYGGGHAQMATETTYPPMYLRSRYAPAVYGEPIMPTPSPPAHAPMPILPKTPPQQVVQYATYTYGTAGHRMAGHPAMHGIGEMHGMSRMHSLGGMHAMQGVGPVVLPVMLVGHGAPMGGVTPPPPYYGHATMATAATVQRSTDETNNGVSVPKRRKVEMVYRSSPVPSSAVTTGSGGGGGGNTPTTTTAVGGGGRSRGSGMGVGGTLE